MVTIENPAQPHFQLIFLKMHLKMRLDGFGGRVPQKTLLEKTGKILNKEYKNSKLGVIAAIHDIEESQK